MIIDNLNKNDNELIGNIKEYKASIDIKDIDFITTLLTSNLYSKPEESFLREIVSNAWDSQVEAGTTDIPILVKVDSDYIIIRDFGTGISSQKMEDIYCKIGSSTKRDSNNYIGAFGIGKYAPLACSNTVFLTSYYNKKMYDYIMIKNGNTITTNLVNTLDTEELNGFSVKINIKSEKISPYLNTLMAFPNIYIDYKNYNYLNTLKIKKYKTFSVYSYNTFNYKILLGNVMYPLDNTKISSKYKNFINSIYNKNFLIHFNIGDLDITPNREEIIYNEKSIKTIEKRLDECIEETNSYIDNVKIKKITKLKDIGSNKYFYDFLDNTVGTFSTATSIDYAPIYSYYNHNINSGLVYKIRARVEIPKAIIDYGTIKTSSKHYWNDYLDAFNSILIVPHSTKLSVSLKEYLINNNANNRIVILQFFDNIINEKIQYLKSITTDKNESDYYLKIFDLWLEKEIKPKLKYIDFSTDSDYIKFKEDRKLSLKENKKEDKKPFKLHVYSEYYKNVIDAKGKTELIKSLKRFKKGIYLDLESTTDYSHTRISQLLKLQHVAVSAPTYEYIRKLNLKCIVTKEDLFKSKFLLKLKTLSENMIWSEYIDWLPITVKNLYNNYREFYESNKYANLLFDLRHIGFNCSKEDCEVKNTLDYIKDKLKLITNIKNKYKPSGYPQLIFMLIKKKSMLLNTEAYDLMNNDPFIKFIKYGEDNQN